LSGAFNITSTSEPESCSAIVGMGDVTIKSDNTVFDLNNVSNVIIDNIKIQRKSSSTINAT